MVDLLKRFYDSPSMREAVREHLDGYADEYAVKKVRKGEDVSGIKDAVGIIQGAFRQLDEMYAEKKEKTVVNQAR